MEPPKYVRLLNTEMRLMPSKKRYWRDAGEWGIRFKEISGKFYSTGMKGLSNILLEEITREEYAEANGEYLPEEY